MRTGNRVGGSPAEAGAPANLMAGRTGTRAVGRMMKGARGPPGKEVGKATRMTRTAPLRALDQPRDPFRLVEFSVEPWQP